MRKYFLLISLFYSSTAIFAQNPAITSWLQNNSITGTYYNEGNSTAIDNNILVNCQKVEYSNNYVYVTTQGVPSYTTGPYLDFNPSQAEAQEAIYKFPLNPEPNNGTPTNTTAGSIGVFINGVSLYDYRDGVSWNPNTNALCGGPGNSPCPGGPQSSMDWNRDAIPAEKDGFDCSKGHPAMGNYHHHQNPSAFKLDLDVISTVCNLYDADGLYVIDSTQHSPILGFAYDGYPIYGAFGYRNNDGSGEITRIKSSYQLKNITTRVNGPDIDQVITTTGPNGGQVSLFLGYFREDYEYVENNTSDYLDEHNGRFCVTPEYPNGTYAYFCTVDENWNSSYPYAVGPTFYGIYSNASVNSISETTTIFTPASGDVEFTTNNFKINIFPNPSVDLIALQIEQINNMVLEIELVDVNSKKIDQKKLNPGCTIAYFNTETLYNGIYFINILNGKNKITKKVIINR